MGSSKPEAELWPRTVESVASELRSLLAAGELDLPLPGGGDTTGRWSALARFGRRDLALARLAEGHCDAVAILREAGRSPEPNALYGVWAAASPETGAALDKGVLDGTVRFCSGAHHLDRALVAASGQLVEIGLDERVQPVPGTWHPQGMEASDSPDVVLSGIPVTEQMLVGEEGFYLSRPGFWVGGAGVAAVWFGGAVGVLDELVELDRELDEHRYAHLGTLHTTLRSTEALLDQAASLVDNAPYDDHTSLAWACRAAAERLGRQVLDRAPEIAGVAALCRNARFAQRLADLQVYVRQHHGERDLAALGRAVHEQAGSRR